MPAPRIRQRGGLRVLARDPAEAQDIHARPRTYLAQMRALLAEITTHPRAPDARPGGPRAGVSGLCAGVASLMCGLVAPSPWRAGLRAGLAGLRSGLAGLSCWKRESATWRERRIMHLAPAATVSPETNTPFAALTSYLVEMFIQPERPSARAALPSVETALTTCALVGHSMESVLTCAERALTTRGLSAP